MHVEFDPAPPRLRYPSWYNVLMAPQVLRSTGTGPWHSGAEAS